MQYNFSQTPLTLNISFDCYSHKINFNFSELNNESKREIETCQIIMKLLNDKCSEFMYQAVDKRIFTAIYFIANQAIMEAYERTGIKVLLNNKL